MAKRKVTKAGWLESQWKAVFDRAESSRLRRAKTTAKQGVVHGVTIRDKHITATVKSGRPGYRVQIAAADWWAPFLDEVATWLSHRPDWLAALYANAWDDAFLEFVDKAGLTLAPKPSSLDEWIAEAHCTCPDMEPLCPHVLTLLYYVVSQMQSEPLVALKYVGIDMEKLLVCAKKHSVSRAKEIFGTDAPKETGIAADLSWLPEEEACLKGEETESTTPMRHRIIPDVQKEQWSAWKKSYMA